MLRLWVLAYFEDEAAVPGAVGFIQAAGEVRPLALANGGAAGVRALPGRWPRRDARVRYRRAAFYDRRPALLLLAAQDPYDS